MSLSAGTMDDPRFEHESGKIVSGKTKNKKKGLSFGKRILIGLVSSVLLAGGGFLAMNVMMNNITPPTPPPPVEAVQLVMPDLSYNELTNILSWDVVENAEGYVYLLDHNDSDYSYERRIHKGEYNAETNKVEQEVSPEVSGDFTVSVKAEGNGQSYLTSEAKTMNLSFEINHTYSQLEMGNLYFNDTNKLLSWDIVPNAVNYEIMANNTVITPKIEYNSMNGRLQCSVKGYEKTNMEFGVKALAEKNQKGELIYTDSEYQIQTFAYTPEVQQIKLQTPSVSYDDTSKILSWAPVQNASNYRLRMDGSLINSAFIKFNNETNRYEYKLSYLESGQHEAQVTALGDGITYTTSDAKMLTVDYTKEQVVENATYAEVKAIIQNQLVDVASTFYNRAVNSNAITIKDINMKTGKVYFNVVHPISGTTFFANSDLGAGLVNCTNYNEVKSYLEENSTSGFNTSTILESNYQESLLRAIINKGTVSYLAQNGISTNDIEWMNASKFSSTSSSTQATNVVLALNNGKIVEFQLDIKSYQWDANSIISDYENGNAATVNNYSINNYSSLADLQQQTFGYGMGM